MPYYNKWEVLQVTLYTLYGLLAFLNIVSINIWNQYLGSGQMQALA